MGAEGTYTSWASRHNNDGWLAISEPVQSGSFLFVPGSPGRDARMSTLAPDARGGLIGDFLDTISV
jgi:hypothetical protein